MQCFQKQKTTKQNISKIQVKRLQLKTGLWVDRIVILNHESHFNNPHSGPESTEGHLGQYVAVLYWRSGLISVLPPAPTQKTLRWHQVFCLGTGHFHTPYLPPKALTTSHFHGCVTFTNRRNTHFHHITQS